MIGENQQYEKQKPVSRISLSVYLVGSDDRGDDIFDTKTLNLADVLSSLPCGILLLFFALLLVCQTHNL